MLPFFMVGVAGPLAAYWADAMLTLELGGTDLSAVATGRIRTKVRKRFACGGLGAAAAFAWVAYAFPGPSPAAAVLVIGLSSACSFAGSAGGYEAAKLEIAAPNVRLFLSLSPLFFLSFPPLPPLFFPIGLGLELNSRMPPHVNV